MKSLRRWVDLISSERGEDFICIADFILAEARISFFMRFQIHTQKRQKYLFCCAKDEAGGRILRFAQNDTSSVTSGDSFSSRRSLSPHPSASLTPCRLRYPAETAPDEAGLFPADRGTHFVKAQDTMFHFPQAENSTCILAFPLPTKAVRLCGGPLCAPARNDRGVW